MGRKSVKSGHVDPISRTRHASPDPRKGLCKHLPPCLARSMHNRSLVVGFGMLLGVSLLGCPPAAKSAKDAPPATEGTASEAPQTGEAKDSKKEKQDSPAPAPAAGGGW